MAININPNRINVSTGSAGPGARRQQQDSGAEESTYKAPARSDINHIPAPESLRTLVSSAVASLRKGVYWDRGTILNLLV